MTDQQQNSAQVFHQLHKQGLLLLANAWDAGSARLIESLGAKAIATTSAGVAWSHGYADGDQLPVRLLIATVTDMARVITVPLSVDIEGGYSDEPNVVGNVVAEVIGAGGVGINIEDGAGTPDLLCAKIEQAKSAGVRLGVNLFVNVRTDVYLRGLVSSERRIDEIIARAERYKAAGADGIFVPGVSSADEIKAIASSVRLPLNVLAWPGLPPASELETLGVRRLSAGSGITQAIYSKIAALAMDFLKNGASDSLADGVMPYPEINALFDVR
jgi:2-methylisocitrate lyase-like PEP mutase family enzyme